MLDLYEYTKEKIAALPEDEVFPAPLLTGNDLIAEGYRPGPLFSEILAAVEDAQLEGRLHDRDEAMEFVRRQYPNARLRPVPRDRSVRMLKSGT